MGFSRLERLFSVIVLVVCFVVVIYSITGYLSQSSVDSLDLISNDLLFTDQRFREIREDHQHQLENPTTNPITNGGITVESGLQGFKIVGEGLQVPKGKENSFLFLKTHKCGTSTLVNMFYLFGIRRRLNFVTNPWTRQLNLNKLVILSYEEIIRTNIECRSCY